MKKILAIDGGGIKGLIPAIVCREIERQHNKQIHEIFDLIAGTSTGAILAGALGIGLWADQIIGLYHSEGPGIFRNPRNTLSQIRKPKYKGSQLLRVLDRYLEPYVLSETKTHIMTTAYDVSGNWNDLKNPTPVFFKSWYSDLADVRLSDAVYASSAAPSYFPPLRLPVPHNPALTACLYDGGLYAGDPTMCAYAEARRLWPDEDLHVVSLGTGTLEGRTKCKDAVGLANLARRVHGWMLDASMDTVPYIAQRVIPSYVRLDTRLRKSVSMDDASLDALSILSETAEKIIEQHGEAIDKIA